MFESRTTAGRQLATSLPRSESPQHLVVGISLGGLCVAAEVAKHLGAPMDAWLAQPVIANGASLGAVTEGRANGGDFAAARAAGLTRDDFTKLIVEARTSLAQQGFALRGTQWLPRVRGLAVVVVSDAALEGDMERAAIEAILAAGAAHVVLATPVATPTAVEKVRHMVQDVVTLLRADDLTDIYKKAGVPPVSSLIPLLRPASATLHEERWRHIVVGVDFGERSRRAAQLAAAMAERDGARLTLVHLAEANHADDPSHEVHQRINSLAQTLRTRSLDVATRVEAGVNHTVLRHALAKLGADLVVVAGSHPTWLQRALHSSLSERIAHGAHVPVLVVSDHAAPALPQRVVVGVNYSEASELALRVAAAEAILSEGHLDVTHVHYDRETARLEHYCAQRIPGFAQSERFSVKQIDGANAAGALVGYARQSDAEMIVVGSSDRGPLVRLLWSSTAEELIQTLPCHVLVTPTPSHTEVDTTSNMRPAVAGAR